MFLSISSMVETPKLFFGLQSSIAFRDFEAFKLHKLLSNIY